MKLAFIPYNTYYILRKLPNIPYLSHYSLFGYFPSHLALSSAGRLYIDCFIFPLLLPYYSPNPAAEVLEPDPALPHSTVFLALQPIIISLIYTTF